MRRSVLFSSLFFLIGTSLSRAAVLADPPVTMRLPSDGPAAFDIAGVKLGMAPSAVRSTLAKAGYRLAPDELLESFRSQVSNRIDQLQRKWHVMRHDAVAGMSGTGPAGERMRVEFRDWPDGPHAVAIRFAADPDRQPQAAFSAQVEAKFGKPTMHVFGGWRWCSPGERQCGPAANAALPALDADYQSRSLTLAVGQDVKDAREALVEIEARKVVPLQNGSAF